MAKPKVDVLVRVFAGTSIEVWAESGIDEILSIEGIVQILYSVNGSLVVCDPRYDINEIADEIRVLLSSKIPDVFKDAYNDTSSSNN